jgi:8-oxo-dGTP pyrophosphatase MutT (NUDIX family)
VQRKHGPWTITETIEKYRDSFIQVSQDQVIKPDGKPGTYGTVKMKSGVAILPLDQDGSVYLTSQFRYAVGRKSIEVACGAIDENETPEEAAKREIQEELGIEANELIDLGQVDLDTSIVQCPARLFLAKNLKFTDSNPEGTETIKPLKRPLSEAVKMVMSSEITHGPSCVLILKASNYTKQP